MKININYLNESFKIEVGTLVTVNDIKLKIEEIKGFPVESQNLIKNNYLLSDTDTLSCKEINENLVLKLYITSFIYIKRPGRIIPRSYKIDLSDSIKNLKERISEEEGISISHQALYLDLDFEFDNIEEKEELNDEKSINDYKLKSGSTIYMLYKSKGGIQIFIRAFDTKSYIINANLEDKIINIKEMILVKLSPNSNIHLFNLYIKYGGYVMRDNEKTLMDYNVQNNGTIFAYI